ncbi:MAG: EAL domain-containing protein [Pseudomonadota bacterium]|nr:EAL domain-containing protein [Pseudomonadota bacterium]
MRLSTGADGNTRRDTPVALPRTANPPGPLLPTVSIVEQTMYEARRSVAAALIGATFVVGSLLIERLWYSTVHETATGIHAAAQQAAADLTLADQRLTSTAQMAVATGEQRWIDDYDRRVPDRNQALATARSLAPSGVAQHFDTQSRAAKDELDNLREAAFGALTVGGVNTARTIFDSDRFQRQTQLLSATTTEFTTATVAATEADVTALNQRAVVIGTLVSLTGVLMGVALWRRLSHRLDRSRSVFLDAEDRIQRLASSDLLTGLANRTALHDAMSTAMARAQRDGHRMALLMIDLDRFKPINDRHGHMIGDLVLKEVAHRLSVCLRSGELRARYGGDEFVVAIEEKDDPAVAHAVAERVIQALCRPMLIDNLSLAIGASVGIARFPDDATHGDELLRKADSALYRAKANGRGGMCFYDARLDEQLAERDSLEQDIRAGIAQGQFVPYYQPIVDLASRSVQSLELLCRWNHPKRGLLSPALFIPLAEQSGLIGAMMLSVLHQACIDLPRFPTHWRLSINVSPQQVLDNTLVPQLLAVLSEHDVQPQRRDVELTETALVNDTARTRQVMQAMKEVGITGTLDNFGIGYSSLCYLAEMSFDKIKIDQSFVHTMHDRPESARIVDAVIGLSRSLGVQAVAEGVETERDAMALRKLGCGLAQGYLFGRPMPVDHVMPALGAIAA